MLAAEARLISTAPDLVDRQIAETVRLYEYVVEGIKEAAMKGNRTVYATITPGYSEVLDITIADVHSTLVKEKLRRDGFNVKQTLTGFTISW